MESFKVTLINEIEKLYKKKKIIVAAILSFIIIILGQIAITFLKNSFGIRAVGSMEFPILVLSVVVNTIIPLFAALVTIDCFTGEFSQNTIKIALTRPVTRLKFFTAKIVAITLFILTNIIFVMIFSILAGIIFNANTFTFTSIIRIFISYFVTILPLIVLVLFIAVLCNLLKSGVGVFFLSVLLFIGFKVLEVVFSQYSSIFFTSLLEWYELWIINKISILTIFRRLMFIVSYGIIFFISGFYLFDKKEI
jgi:ABC-2 type transport system permease protein